MRVMFVALVVTLGCGGGDGGAADAGTPDAAAISVVAPPVLTPCPTGWREVTAGDVDDVASCDPWPATGRAPCAAVDEAHFPGEPECVRIGAACPAGEFPEGLPPGATVRYVRAGGGAGGVGTMADPYGSIVEAMAAAAPGTILALGKGTFDEDVQVAPGVTLWGACVAGTVVGRSSYDELRGTINVDVADVVVTNLRLAGARVGVWATGAGAGVQLTEVVIAGAVDIGVYGEAGAALVLRTVAIRDTAKSPAALYGDGIQIWLASLDAARLVAERNTRAAVSAYGVGATVQLADAALVDTLPGDSDAIGVGLELDEAVVEAARVAIEGNTGVGVWVTEVGTVLHLTDAVIRDTKSFADVPGQPEGGRALNLINHGRAELSRTLVAGNREMALFAQTATVLTLDDVVVRDTLPQEYSGWFGRALNAQYGADVTVTRVIFRGNRDVTVFAAAGVGGAPPVVRLIDVAVLDTLPQACEAAGTCAWSVSTAVGAYDGARVDALRFRFARSALLGVQLATGGAVDLHDGVIEANPIGINLQTDPYDLARLQDRVRLVGNGINLSADQLAVPQAR